MLIITCPKYFQANNITSFLNEAQKIFSLEGKLVSDVYLDLRRVQELDMLGVLIIYKFVEYTVVNQCFKSPKFLNTELVISTWDKYGFTDLINAFMQKKEKDLSKYRNLKIQIEDSFIIAPQALLRHDDYSEENLKKRFLPKIQQYYNEDSKVTSMIFICLSEIMLNFWEHAVVDTKSIIVANGNKNKIEIACADTGNGIISTLKLIESFKTLSNEKILAKSVEKGVTSKKNTNHMGYGLWILNEIVKLTKGRLQLFSEGAYYINDFGKIRTGTCGYWKGAIIYISLPLQKPKTLTDILEFKETNVFNNLQINWK